MRLSKLAKRARVVLIGAATMWAGLVISQGVVAARGGLGFVSGMKRLLGNPVLVLVVSVYSLAWGAGLWWFLRRLGTRRDQGRPYP